MIYRTPGRVILNIFIFTIAVAEKTVNYRRAEFLQSSDSKFP